MELNASYLKSSHGGIFFIVHLKFILSMLKNILLLCIFFTQDENIFSGLAMTDEKGGVNYNYARGIFLSGITLFYAAVIAEMLIQLTGYTIRYKKNNIIVICLSIFSIMMLVFFILDQFHYMVIWYIFIVTQITPTVLEIYGFIESSLFFSYKYDKIKNLETKPIVSSR
jgi:hypothetical protein